MKEERRTPWWLSGKESTCQHREHWFDLWSEEIPHALEQQGPCAAAIESVRHSPGAATAEPVCPKDRSRVPRARAPQERPLQWEAWAPQLGAAPAHTTRAKPVQPAKPQRSQNQTNKSFRRGGVGWVDLLLGSTHWFCLIQTSRVHALSAFSILRPLASSGLPPVMRGY